MVSSGNAEALQSPHVCRGLSPHEAGSWSSVTGQPHWLGMVHQPIYLGVRSSWLFVHYAGVRGRVSVCVCFVCVCVCVLIPGPIYHFCGQLDGRLRPYQAQQRTPIREPIVLWTMKR